MNRLTPAKKPENSRKTTHKRRSRIRPLALAAGAFLVSAALISACVSNGDADQARAGENSREPSRPESRPESRQASRQVSRRVSLTVSVPSSAASAITQIAANFERTNRGVNVAINSGPSNALASQVSSGADVDVLLSADIASLSSLISQRQISRPRIFARNQMMLVVSARAPEIRGLHDLRNADVVALCAETVPCGAYAERVLIRAGVKLKETQITRGTDAVSTLGAVRFGDAEAAIIYKTDARAAGNSVVPQEIADRFNVIAKYPAAVVRASKHLKEANAFLRYLEGSRSQRVLRRAGFSAP